MWFWGEYINSIKSRKQSLQSVMRRPKPPQRPVPCWGGNDHPEGAICGCCLGRAFPIFIWFMPLTLQASKIPGQNTSQFWWCSADFHSKIISGTNVCTRFYWNWSRVWTWTLFEIGSWLTLEQAGLGIFLHSVRSSSETRGPWHFECCKQFSQQKLFVSSPT